MIKTYKSPDAPLEIEESRSNFSSWAVEVDFNYDDYLFYHGEVQYNVTLPEMQLANSTIEYHSIDNNGFIQANYHTSLKIY